MTNELKSSSSFAGIVSGPGCEHVFNVTDPWCTAAYRVPSVIEPIRWRLLGGDHPPFERGGRHLRITVYCPNRDELTAEEASALSLIRELAHLDSLRVVDSDPAAPWRLEIDTRPNEHGVASAILVGPADRRIFCAMHPRDWIEEAIFLLGVGSNTDPRTLALASHLPIFEAHQQICRDVFITTERQLLQVRSRVPDANVRDVFDGLRIIGLYLRSVGDFTIRASDRGRHRFGRDLFYWVLCRQRLPAMWRYFAACLHRGKVAQDGMEYLGNSILDRCVRVLQARDEVGFEFYKRQDNSTRDRMLYHFDYLTLMLSGALDAQARIAREAYGVSNIPKRRTSFRNSAFRHAMEAAGDTTLTRVVGAGGFLDFQRLLGALRNSVHSTGLRGMGVSRSGQHQSSVVRVFEDAQTVWDVSNALGSRDDFGVTSVVGVAIEPYTCAVRLAELGLNYVNQIAEATDVGSMLPRGVAITDLPNAPPEDDTFGREIRRRIDALG